MSGTNPFRRRNIFDANSGGPHNVQENKSENRPQAQPPVLDTDIVKPAKKTVRIISPHSASDNEYRMPNELFSLPSNAIISPQSSPESANSSEGSSLVDPFDVESSDDGAPTTEDEDLRRNTLSNAGSLGGSESPLGATTSPNDRSSGLADRVVTPRPAAGQQKASKSHYTVDEFKELLLTGMKAPTETTAPSVSQSAQNSVDRSSNTDTSSTSRRSIYEPVSGPQLETPRTSHEISPSDDEIQRSVQISTSHEGKPWPTAKPHHGISVKQSAMQMVSVNDLPFGSVPTAVAGKSSPISPRTPTDLNKPLPLPPASRPFDTHGPHIGMPYPNHQHSQSPSSPSRARVPPPPPPSRGLSQGRPKSLYSNPVKSIQCSESLPDIYHPSSVPASKSEFPPGLKLPPPPPPPRRPGPIRRLSGSSSASALSTVATPASSSFTDDSVSNVSKQCPPVPPTRNRSTSSLKRTTKVTSRPGTQNVPPAPPRRRGSSQSSFDPSFLTIDRRSSELDRQRRDSAVSSVQDKDVMADLSTLQKEVDALRGKFRE